MEKINLNDNDQKLLAFCKDSRKTVNEIAKHLEIAPANVTTRINKLEALGLVSIERQEKRGMKTYVRTKTADKTKEYFTQILREIQKRGGEISEEDYLGLLPLKPGEQNSDKYKAPLLLQYRLSLPHSNLKY